MDMKPEYHKNYKNERHELLFVLYPNTLHLYKDCKIHSDQHWKKCH